jgi:hypothetical protein
MRPVSSLLMKWEGRGDLISHFFVPQALTQPLTEMSTKNLSEGVKGGQCIRLTTFLPSVS